MLISVILEAEIISTDNVCIVRKHIKKLSHVCARSLEFNGLAYSLYQWVMSILTTHRGNYLIGTRPRGHGVNDPGPFAPARLL